MGVSLGESSNEKQVPWSRRIEQGVNSFQTPNQLDRSTRPLSRVFTGLAAVMFYR